MAAWEEAMWAELEEMPLEQQVVACGEWITHMVQSLLPRLGKVRRERIVQVLKQEGWDATRLAETIGSRPGTIARLAEEGRAAARVQHLVETPPQG